jgi:hypothetical protein
MFAGSNVLFTTTKPAQKAGEYSNNCNMKMNPAQDLFDSAGQAFCAALSRFPVPVRQQWQDRNLHL